MAARKTSFPSSVPKKKTGTTMLAHISRAIHTSQGNGSFKMVLKKPIIAVISYPLYSALGVNVQVMIGS